MQLVLYGNQLKDMITNSALAEILKASKDLALVLMQDAVNGAVWMKKNPDAELTKFLIEIGVSLFCNEEDLAARGFTKDHIHPSIDIKSYKDIIDLIESAEKVHSWL